MFGGLDITVNLLTVLSRPGDAVIPCSSALMPTAATEMLMITVPTPSGSISPTMNSASSAVARPRDPNQPIMPALICVAANKSQLTGGFSCCPPTADEQ